MKKFIALLGIMTISILAYANIERYFFDEIEVTRQEFMAIDSTLIRSKEVWSSGDTITHILSPGIYARIDSISHPGKKLIVRKSEAEIAVIDSIMSNYRQQSANLKIGSSLPNFTFDKYIIAGDSILSYSEAIKGKVLLLNFWATWCGPCIEELKPQHLQSVLNQFADNERFMFIPISVNHNREEIDNFFNTPIGIELEWLKPLLAWDKNGEFAEMLSNGGIPLTILIDENGTIRLNEAGAFISNEELTRLKDEIYKLLD